jgi:hypothetical protein
MNRLLTTIVQLALVIPAVYCVRYMIADMKEMWRESHN